MKPKLSTVKLLETMIAFKPVTDDIAAVNRLTIFLADYLAGHGIWTRMERIGKRNALYAATRRTRSPKIMALAHLDVVPAEPALFTLRKRGDWLIGRGAGDCLGNSAVLAQTLIRLAGKAEIGAIFSTDEETKSATTSTMVKRGYKTNALLVLDSGGLTPHLVIAQKARLALRLVAHGKAAHGSTPWAGRNAIDRLIDGYSKVRNIFPQATAKNAWLPTLSANIINAGIANNCVPDKAELILDIRLTDTDKPADIIRKIRSLSGLKTEIMEQAPLVTTDPQSPLAKSFIAALQRAFGKKPILRRLNGATEAHYFTKLNIPILITSIPYTGPHSSKEQASAKGMVQFEQFLADFLSNPYFTIGKTTQAAPVCVRRTGRRRMR